MTIEQKMNRDSQPANTIRDHGPWRIHSTHDVYNDPFIKVWRDEVTRPDGRPGQHVVVSMKPGVCVIPMDDEGQVYLTSEFHYAVGRVSLEGVSGGIEPGEEALLTAERELAEELGLVAQKFESLATVDPFTTIIASPTQLFLATSLSHVATKPEGTEQIDLVRLPLAAAIQKIQSGQITHAPTCVALLLIERQRTK